MSDLLIRLKEQMVLNPNNAYIPEIEYTNSNFTHFSKPKVTPNPLKY
jgi:hypothetical protein